MVVNEEDVINIMGGMEHAGGIRLNDHKRKLKNRYILFTYMTNTYIIKMQYVQQFVYLCFFFYKDLRYVEN